MQTECQRRRDRESVRKTKRTESGKGEAREVRMNGGDANGKQTGNGQKGPWDCGEGNSNTIRI